MPPLRLPKSAIGSHRDRTRTTSSALEPLAAQTSNARIRRPPRNRSLTTPSRLLWEQQIQHVVSQAAANSATTTENQPPDFSWNPSLAPSREQSLENRPATQQHWSLSGTPQTSGVDIPAFSVEAAPPYQGGDSVTRNLVFDEPLNTEDMRYLPALPSSSDRTKLMTW
jgi:hypothetical protein